MRARKAMREEEGFVVERATLKAEVVVSGLRPDIHVMEVPG